jgi:GNAT superfamily N-acetyltransferase
MDAPSLRAAPAADEQNPFGQPPRNLPRHLPAPPARVADRGDVRIERIDLARKSDRSRFLDVADLIQRGDPDYIAPLRMERMRFLDPAKNPAFKQLDVLPLLATRGGRLAGRITAHVDHAYDAYHGVKVAWFGFFESVDDRRVAHALLDEAVAWAKARGATEMVGPCNFTTNHQVGMLVENFDRPPFVEMTYNPPWYEALVSSYGFGKAKDLLVWWIVSESGTDDPKMRRYFEVSEKARQRYGLNVRTVNMKDFRNEVARLFRLYNATWEKNWGFVPVTEPEFEAIAHDLKPVIDPALVLIVEDRAGTPVGFSVTLPDVNEVMPRDGRLLPFGWWRLVTGRKSIRWARLFALGVIPEYRRRGIEALLAIQTALRARDRGIRGGEIGWTLEDNILITRTVESFGGRLDRRYRLFGMDLIAHPT